MINELHALKAALASAVVGGAHVLTNADKPPRLPYLLIEPVNSNPFVEDSLAFEDGDLDFLVRVKGVGATPESALIALRNARTALTAGRRLGALPVTGRVVDVEYKRHEADYADTQTLLPDTAQPLCLSVDTYRLVSQPA